MRTLQYNELHTISGGFEPVMILSFVAGFQELSFAKTIAFSSLFYGGIGGGVGGVLGAIGSLMGVSSALGGALLGGAAGAGFGAIDSLLFYGFGSLFTKPESGVVVIAA